MWAGVAQLVEQLTCNQQVGGSIPSASSIFSFSGCAKWRARTGGVPEWPKGSDCKSDAKASQVRILPPPPLIARGHRIVAITSAFQADDAGSIPAARSNLKC